MRGYVLSRYAPDGAALRDDVKAPTAGPGQVLVRVHGAGLNPVDFKTRNGKIKLVLKYELPVTMGNELSGVIEALGPAVSGWHVGDRVIARVKKARMGSLAELNVVDVEHLASAPAALDLVDAAGLPLAGLTAFQALRELGVDQRPGMRLLITGGAGGVGTFAVQLAKLMGAHVTTTASPKGAELCKSLGADVVVDYTSTHLATLPREFDDAFDTVGTASECFPVVKAGGTVLSVGAMPEPQTARDLGMGGALPYLFWLASFGLRRAARGNGVSYRYLFMHESGKELAELVALVDAGKLRVVVDRTFPFAQTAEAFAYLEQGRAKGKVIVRVAP